MFHSPLLVLSISEWLHSLLNCIDSYELKEYYQSHKDKENDKKENEEDEDYDDPEKKASLLIKTVPEFKEFANLFNDGNSSALLFS